MNASAGDPVKPTRSRFPTGRLFWKYLTFVVGAVCTALAVNGLFGIWLSYQDHKASLIRIQREQTDAAADKIGQFIKEIEAQLGWMTHVSWSEAAPDERRLDALRLLRQVPAITELALVDEKGREQLRISRLAMDATGSGTDLSREPTFTEAVARKTYYGPVYFRHGSEPYLTLAQAGSRRDAGVVIAEVNLIFVWDVVSKINPGQHGKAYVVDASGRLIAHPDISLVLRNTDFSHLPQVQAARAGLEPASGGSAARDLQGQPVLAAHAVIAPLGWLVFVELPLGEAYAPVYDSLIATAVVLLGGLVLAVIIGLALARRMVMPIRMLQAGAARIGAGALDHRITIKSGDELEALGDQFNSMAAQLQQSYATLERKVEERTHQLEVANLAKSRFLAVASHDLRQPLHALNLFVGQLLGEKNRSEQTRLVGRIDAAVTAMNDLFNSLLDISRLDAGVLKPNVTEFPISYLFKRLETTFAEAAREKELRLRVVSSAAWVRSDPIMLEQVLLNLVSNAVRYTRSGGVLLGCRRRGEQLRVEVWDTGVGIPTDQRRHVFGEFYQLAGEEQDRSGGLGLGLAIVDRLCGLLDHPIELFSEVGSGSRFCVSVPSAAPRRVSIPAQRRVDPISGKLLVVIDDDDLVLDSMRGLLKSWDCEVIASESEQAMLIELGRIGRRPDLIISDYHLARGSTGFELIERLRCRFGANIPACLISGDTAPERLREAAASGYHLLHKPVPPMALRAMLGQLMRRRRGTVSPISASDPSPVPPP